jgi:hypothetical protein
MRVLLRHLFEVSGLFGHPEWIEKSGLQALDKLDVSDILQARRFYQFALAMADCASASVEFLLTGIQPVSDKTLSKIARTLRESDEWCVAELATCAIAVSRARADRVSRTD